MGSSPSSGSSKFWGARRGNEARVTQYEQENDLGGGGGEIDDEMMDDAWRTAEERRSTANADDDHDEPDAAA